MTSNPALSTEEKVSLLRELCQGYGMTSPESFIEREEVLRKLHDVGPDKMDAMFHKAADTMTAGKYKDAFLNALWGRNLMNLTDRRTDYLAKEGDITYRTLVRHEQEGAEIFLKFFEAQARSLAEPSAVIEDDAGDPDVEALRRRVSQLEAVVHKLYELSETAYSALDWLLTHEEDSDTKRRVLEKREQWFDGVDKDGNTLFALLMQMPGFYEIEIGAPTPSTESQPD